MACFLAPVAEAIVVSVVKKKVEKQEKPVSGKISFSRKLGWLNKMLWGGSFLLLIEHIWHGEVALWPPFLTAMNSAAETQTMLQEIATAGVSMTVLITAVWGVMLLAVKAWESRKKTVEE